MHQLRDHRTTQERDSFALALGKIEKSLNLVTTSRQASKTAAY
jgi:hypothetical protein